MFAPHISPWVLRGILLAHALAPFFLVPTSSNTTSTFTALHPELNGYFSLFLEDYEPNQDLELSSIFFKLTFECMLHLLTNGPSRIVFEHFRNYFHRKDSASGFLQLFQLCSHIAQDHIPPQITCIFGSVHLLTMTKPSSGIRPIIVGETLDQFISCTLCF
jgi:hypothetical protein